MAATLALLQQPAAPAPPSPPDIVVEGRSPEATERLVDQVVRAESGRTQVARWNDPLCPQVLGADPEQARGFVDRLGEIAAIVHVSVTKGDCKPNVVIVLTDDADALVQAIFKAYPRMGEDTRSGIGWLVRRKRAFAEPRPVRWWNVGTTTDRYGQPVPEAPFQASRLHPPTLRNSLVSLVIVDGRRMKHMTWGQLHDYLSMIVLTQPRLGPAYSAASILALFGDDAAARPKGLTASDRAVLTALYSSDPTLESESMRRKAVKAAIAGASGN